MTTVPLELFLTSVLGVLTASAGVIYGIIAKGAATRVKGSIDVLAKQVQVLEECYGEVKTFQTESRGDRANLHGAAGSLEKAIAVITTKLEVMGKQLDYVYKKVYNGGPE